MSADPLLHDTALIVAKTENTSSSCRHIQGYNDANNCWQTKGDIMKPTTEGYETIVSFLLRWDLNLKFK